MLEMELPVTLRSPSISHSRTIRMKLDVSGCTQSKVGLECSLAAKLLRKKSRQVVVALQFYIC